MLKSILEWPSKRLKTVANPIFKIDEETKQLAIDLIDTCNVMLGVGLAATQIGVAKRMITIKPKSFNSENIDPAEYNKDYIIMINPLIETSGNKIEWIEECLSLVLLKLLYLQE